MWRMLIAVIVVVLWSGTVHATQCRGIAPELKEPALCSIAFDFDGECGVPKYKFPDWDTVAIAVGAWEKLPIRIIIAAADVVVMARGAPSFVSVFAGNSYNADLMTPERKAVGVPSGPHGEFFASVHAEEHFPADAGMQFPAGQPMEAAHLDVHVYCWPKGASYTGSLSIWYKLDPP